MNASETKDLVTKHVVPSYGRFDLVLDRGEGSYVWDASARRYLDLAGGIAVNSLGHAHPAITEALAEQSRRLMHVSNLYYTTPQAELAAALVRLIGPGRCFFCNSGAEANEGLYKLARKFGQERKRFEIITAQNSFHGRTLAGIAATGQEKVKTGFAPAVAGFRHVPFNDLAAVREAVTAGTTAVLIESIQGESGVVAATPEYLLGLRELCDQHELLLMIDEVQSGHFRTGAFHGWQRILEKVAGADGFAPDAVSMAKSLGGGFPIGAFWVRERHAELLSPGTHATTFGGNPLGCAVALRVLGVIEDERLAANARNLGAFIVDELRALARHFPHVLREVRGYGLMIGIEFDPTAPGFGNSEKLPALQAVALLHEAGVLTVPAATAVVRLLPALNLRREEAAEGLRAVTQVVSQLSSR